MPGTLFVGKIALKNLTPAETKLTLYSIASIDRLGARQTHFGRVKMRIAGIIGHKYELGSGYELALRALRTNARTLNQLYKVISSYLDELSKTYGASAIVQRGIEDIVMRVDLEAIIKEAWNDAVTRKRILDEVTSAKTKTT